MRGGRASRTAAVGAVLLGVAAAVFIVEPFGHDVSETIGLLPLLLGFFLVAEGVLALWRAARLRDAGRGRSPK
jgi:uncharacterized membrane protein HdeD (DUF308 family)